MAARQQKAVTRAVISEAQSLSGLDFLVLVSVFDEDELKWNPSPSRSSSPCS